MSASNMAGWSKAANAIFSGNADEKLMAASELCLLYDESTGKDDTQREPAYDLTHRQLVDR